MKILAVRGEGLASLPKFEVHFSEGPLAQAGLFLICGPTGAGKSTLLDALCLALYDKTPRLSGPSSVKVGYADELPELRLKATDPRAILRRGAVEAHAQVDFCCGDKGRYRATWRVRRARYRSDGRIQEQTLELGNLDTGEELSSHKKTETLETIERLLGLSFSEFCRSALLAQGDFAQFLKSTGDERAELLEKMTGTGIYAQLSQLAHQRAKEEGDLLQSLRDRQAGYPTLPEEERGALHEKRQGLLTRRGALVQQVEALRLGAAWYESHAALGLECQAAAEELSAAQRGLQEADEAQREVQSIEAAQALRPLVEALDRGERALETAQRAITAVAERLRIAQKAREDTGVRLVGGQESLGQAQKQARADEPSLGRARELDLQLREAVARHAEVQEQARVLGASFQQSHEKLAGLRLERELLHQQGEEAARWLEEHRRSAPLVASWPSWREALEGLVRVMAEGKKLLAQKERLAQKQQLLREDLQKKETALAGPSAQKQAQRTQLDEVRAALVHFRHEHPPEALQEERGRLSQQLPLLQESLRVLQQIAGLQTKEVQRTQALLEHESRAAAASTAVAQLQRQMQELAAKEAGARKDLQVAQAAQELASRRPELLVPGEPCPLCGSPEHPAAGAPGPKSQVVSRLATECQHLRAALDKLQEERAGAEKQAHTSQQMAVQVRAQLAELHRDQQQLSARFAGEVPDEEEIRGSLREGTARQEHIARLEGRLAALQKQADALQHGYDRAAAEVEQLERAIAEQRTAAAEADRALEHHQHLMEGNRAEESRRRDFLAQPFSQWPDWQAAQRARPQAFLRELDGEVGSWQTWQERRDEAGRRLQQLEAPLAVATQETERRAAEMAAAEKLARKREADRDALRKERAQLFSGKAVAQVEQEHRDRIRQAEEALQKARERAAAADRDHAAASEAERQAQGQLGAAIGERDEAHLRLQAALSTAGLGDLPDLRRLLLCEEGSLLRLRQRITERREALTRAEMTHTERERRLLLHEKKGAPRWPREALAQLLEEARQEDERAGQEIAALFVQLGQDEQNRKTVATLLLEIERQRAAAEKWQEMGELIGSADGKKFRKFAQSLTLDTLLEQANQHLQVLQPRYRLERIPGYDMDLQIIDRDMGDEVRGCTTLSGGESFLASLSLALGLSSLSARDVRVESLFIDEGFGSLDNESLEVAIAALDQLQAEGRQVGLISHVPEVAERIGYQVRVDRRGPGQSSVTVTDGTTSLVASRQRDPLEEQDQREFALELVEAKSRKKGRRRVH